MEKYNLTFSPLYARIETGYLVGVIMVRERDCSMDIVDFEVNASALAGALAGLDRNTYRHSQRVQRLAVMIGKIMGLTQGELTTLSLGSLLHDVGKKYVPREILLKETTLAQEEWEVIELHPVYGWEYANAVNLGQVTQEIILHHHLWFDGQGGYPGHEEPVCPSLLAQITTVADVVDAMTQDRPYRRALSVETSLDYLQEKSGSQFGPDVVEIVIQNLAEIVSVMNV